MWNTVELCFREQLVGLIEINRLIQEEDCDLF